MFESAGQLALTAVFLVAVVNKVVDGLIKPLFDKYEWDKFPIMYIAWALGGVVVGLSNINLFVDVAPDLNYTAGLILSAIVAGGGANILNDFMGGGNLIINNEVVEGEGDR